MWTNKDDFVVLGGVGTGYCFSSKRLDHGTRRPDPQAMSEALHFSAGGEERAGLGTGGLLGCDFSPHGQGHSPLMM